MLYSKNNSNRGGIKIKKYTILTGIENGELVVPEINLWADSGRDRVAKKIKVIGRVSHNTKVQILDEATDGGIKFYKIKSPDDLVGWITEYFVSDITEEKD